MAIVYSYQQETQPALGDLLLGTDVSASGKPTKSFSIQSIVDLVQTGVPGGGTVTSVGANSTTFVTLSGGPITTSGIISASLSATGTPSATTYLRGDNTWAAISSSLNTTYTITSAQNGSAANIRLTGSNFSQTLVTLAAGANISLTDNGSNRITIGVTNLQLGSVTSVTTGGGLYIVSGSATVNPVLGIDLTGLNNYIKFGENQTTAISADFIAFNQDSSENVKTTTLGALSINALTNVKSYIDAGDVGDIRNDTDTFTTTAVVNNVVSLTSAEYAALTPNANTLYIIVGAATSYINTLAFTNNIFGTEYTIGGDQVGATRSGISGASYAFNTSITPNSGFYFSSGPTITNASGVFGTADETVYTILGGTVSEIVEPPITATLALSLSPSLGTNGVEYTLGGNLAGATQSGPSPLTYSFNTTITANSGYEFTTGPAITNASGTITGSQSVVTTIAGTIEAIGPAPVTVTGLLNLDNLTGVSGQVNGSVSPGSFSGDSPVAYSFTPSATANPNYTIQNLTYTGDISGNATTSKTAVMYANGNVVENTNNAIVNLIIDESQVSGNTSWYTLTGDLDGAQQLGAVPFNYAFNTAAPANTNYAWTDGPYITNASGQKQVAGTYYETTSISGTIALAPPPVRATLQVNYNITGEQVYTPTGDQTGAFQEGVQPFNYSFSTGASIPSGYVWTLGPTISPNPNSGTISANTTVTTDVSGTIAVAPASSFTIYANPSSGTNPYQGFSTSNTACSGTGVPVTVYNSGGYTTAQQVFNAGNALYVDSGLTTLYNGGNTYFTDANSGGNSFQVGSSGFISTFSACPAPPEQGTVNLTFSNNTTDPANTTTALGGVTSVTQNVGTTYTFANSIIANSGYEFTTGPSWTDSASNNGTGTATGTVVSGTTNINQNVTGTVAEIVPPSCNVNVGYTFSIFTICDAAETTPITMYHLGACDICGATSIDASFVSSMNINDVVQVKYQDVYMPFQKQSAGSVAVSAGSCLVCPEPPAQYTVTLAFSNTVTGFANTTTSLTPGATITGNAGDAYQFVHTISTDPGYEFTSGPFWTDSVSNNGTGTINGTIPSSDVTITQSVTGTVQAIAVNCTEFFTSPSGVATSSAACSSMDWSARRRHNGALSDPEIGDIIYTTGTCATPFNGAGLWYTVLADTSVIRIQGDGSVTNKLFC